MRLILRENGLSLVMLGLFVASFIGQSVTGFKVYNEDQRSNGKRQ